MQVQSASSPTRPKCRSGSCFLSYPPNASPLPIFCSKIAVGSSQGPGLPQACGMYPQRHTPVTPTGQAWACAPPSSAPVLLMPVLSDCGRGTPCLQWRPSGFVESKSQKRELVAIPCQRLPQRNSTAFSNSDVLASFGSNILDHSVSALGGACSMAEALTKALPQEV